MSIDWNPMYKRIKEAVHEAIERQKHRPAEKFEVILIMPIHKSEMEFSFGNYNEKWDYVFGWELRNIKIEDGDDYADMEGDFKWELFDLDCLKDISDFIKRWDLESRVKR